MSFRTASLALCLLCVAALRGDEGSGPKVEMRTLKGDIVTGELVGISASEIVINRAEGKLATPIPQVLLLDFPGVTKTTPPDKFTDLELVDGSIFHCESVAFKGKEVAMKLTAGKELTVPLIKVSNILNQANDPKYRNGWTKYLGEKRKSDVLSVLNAGVPNHFDVTLGAVTEDGKKIKFTYDGEARTRDLDTIHGLIWDRAADPNMPLSICKLIDEQGSVVMIQEMALKGEEVQLTTPAGVKLTYPLKSVAKLDFNRDKLKYLSEMEWKVEKQPADFFNQPVRDGNPDKKGACRLGETEYPRGLSLWSNTALVFDLGGGFREFRTLAGIDRTVGDNKLPVTLVVECDGRERAKLVFTRDDKELLQALTINVKDVQKLRIVVSTPVPRPGHLTLADAKVMK